MLILSNWSFLKIWIMQEFKNLTRWLDHQKLNFRALDSAPGIKSDSD